jgi:hypothetical protein
MADRGTHRAGLSRQYGGLLGSRHARVEQSADRPYERYPLVQSQVGASSRHRAYRKRPEPPPLPQPQRHGGRFRKAARPDLATVSRRCGSQFRLLPSTRAGGQRRSPIHGSILPSALRAALETEAKAEIADGHELSGLPVTAIARRGACDDVVFSIETIPVWFALVHLTWRQRPEQPPWPMTTRLTLPLSTSLEAHSHRA